MASGGEGIENNKIKTTQFIDLQSHKTNEKQSIISTDWIMAECCNEQSNLLCRNILLHRISQELLTANDVCTFTPIFTPVLFLVYII